MPLVAATLGQNLESVLSKLAKLSFSNAKSFAMEVCSFIETGMTAMAGMPVASPQMMMLAKALVDVWDAQLLASIAGVKTAMAISDVLKGTITSGGSHGVGALMLDDPVSLGKDIGDIYDAKVPVAVVAKMFSMAIYTYLSKAPFQGSGIPPAMIPDISPLS